MLAKAAWPAVVGMPHGLAKFWTLLTAQLPQREQKCIPAQKIIRCVLWTGLDPPPPCKSLCSLSCWRSTGIGFDKETALQAPLANTKLKCHLLFMHDKPQRLQVTRFSETVMLWPAASAAARTSHMQFLLTGGLHDLKVLHELHA